MMDYKASPRALQIAEPVRLALNDRGAVVALESTVIAHGLPHPFNLETALACEDAVREMGAVPATLGVVDGLPKIGLEADEISVFASRRAPDGRQIEKVGLNNLAGVMLDRRWGATTVASSLRLAQIAGIRVFSTGGIGGVHRGASESLDISADLTALGNTRLICVCAGAKAILDLPKTIEHLETLGVPIIGFRTDEFPAFYSRSSGLSVDTRIETVEEAAKVAVDHWSTGGRTAVLVCVPVPADSEIDHETVSFAIDKAIAKASDEGVRGKAVTPFLLGELERLTSGRTVETNRVLLVNNARVAASIAVRLSKTGFEQPDE